MTNPKTPVVPTRSAMATELEIELDRGTRIVLDESHATDESRATDVDRAVLGAKAAPNTTANEVVPVAVRSLAHPNTAASATVEPTKVAVLEGSETSVSASTVPKQSATAQEPKIDLGLDGRLFRSVPSQSPLNARTKKPASGVQLEQALNASLRNSMKADDVGRGLAIGNALVGSLTSAVRNAGPTEGNALISVTINSAGEISEMSLMRGDPGDWSLALRSFRRQAKQRRLQLPTGAQGLRITYDVSTKLQLPSGKKVDAAAVRLKHPSLAPDGLTLRGDFDVADLSGKTSQAVSARIVHEEVL